LKFEFELNVNFRVSLSVAAFEIRDVENVSEELIAGNSNV
jgi:hypothetical protein